MWKLKTDANRPSEPPVTARDLKKWFQMIASVHCGMMYGKMKIADR